MRVNLPGLLENVAALLEAGSNSLAPGGRLAAGESPRATERRREVTSGVAASFGVTPRAQKEWRYVACRQDTLSRLRKEAARREMKVEALASELLARIAADGLVAAILDDGG
jgi:hypothetical protein